ncbi:MAG: RNA polymerase sigma factor [Clostridia bacterium]|nr:RNA polymerase sigma factor [Clostridia bacterium]
MQLEHHMHWLFQQSLHLCGSFADAQELSQEVLLAALQHQGDVENEQAWLCAVLRRKHVDLLRRRYRLPTVCIDMVPEVAEEAPEEDSAAEVRREIAYLACVYREAIVRHYLQGEKVADVAAALGLPRGTVLSRLFTGREHMRKGLTNMEDYGKQSYQPERLDVSCNGRPGLHDEPWSLVCDDLMKQNILIAAYDHPVTPVGIARHLGIPTAYVEQAVDALVRGELMRRIGGKVATDFLITTPEQRLQGLDLQIDLAHVHYDTIMAPVRTLVQALQQSPCWSPLRDSEQWKLAEYFTLHLLSRAIYAASKRITPGEEVFPARLDGGQWVAQGFRVPMDYDWADNRFRRYCYGGERFACWEQFMGMKSVTLRVYDTQPDLNRYAHGPVDLDDSQLCRLMYILHRGLAISDTGIDPALMQDIPHLTACGVLRTEEGRPACDIPVLAKAEYDALDAMCIQQLHILTDILEPLLQDIFPRLKVPLPAHLQGRVAELRRYSCYALPMALREEAILRLEWSESQAAPPMLLIIEE